MQHLQVKPWWNFTVAHSACPSCGGAGLRSVRPASPPLTLQEGRAPALQQGQEAALNEQPLSAEARMRAQVAVHERPLAAHAPSRPAPRGHMTSCKVALHALCVLISANR